MEVLVGPTFSIEVSSPEDVNPAASAAPSASTNCIFLKDDGDGDDDDNEIANHQGLISSRLGSGIRINDLDNNSTDSSSSIGAPDDSDDEGAEVDSGSSSSKGALASFDSLEDSLPIKSGLSNHFAGKSKSFTNLSDVMSGSASTVKDLVKPENPFNKRRRILMANKWCTRRRKSSSSSSSSFYTWSNPKSMPLLALPEDQEEEDQHQLQLQLQPSESEEDDDEITTHHKQHLSKLQDRRMFRTSFMSHSCFSLTDLQEDEQYQ